jgi:hypothetical protein
VLLTTASAAHSVPAVITLQRYEQDEPSQATTLQYLFQAVEPNSRAKPPEMLFALSNPNTRYYLHLRYMLTAVVAVVINALDSRNECLVLLSSSIRSEPHAETQSLIIAAWGRKS